MPWRCPACQTQIQHNDLDPRPRPKTIYRCHICRLELVLNERTGHLTVTPVIDTANDRKRSTE